MFFKKKKDLYSGSGFILSIKCLLTAGWSERDSKATSEEPERDSKTTSEEQDPDEVLEKLLSESGSKFAKSSDVSISLVLFRTNTRTARHKLYLKKNCFFRFLKFLNNPLFDTKY